MGEKIFVRRPAEKPSTRVFAQTDTTTSVTTGKRKELPTSNGKRDGTTLSFIAGFAAGLIAGMGIGLIIIITK